MFDVNNNYAFKLHTFFRMKGLTLDLLQELYDTWLQLTRQASSQIFPQSLKKLHHEDAKVLYGWTKPYAPKKIHLDAYTIDLTKLNDETTKLYAIVSDDVELQKHLKKSLKHEIATLNTYIARNEELRKAFVSYEKIDSMPATIGLPNGAVDFWGPGSEDFILSLMFHEKAEVKTTYSNELLALQWLASQPEFGERLTSVPEQLNFADQTILMVYIAEKDDMISCLFPRTSKKFVFRRLGKHSFGELTVSTLLHSEPKSGCMFSLGSRY